MFYFWLKTNLHNTSFTLASPSNKTVGRVGRVRAESGEKLCWDSDTRHKEVRETPELLCMKHWLAKQGKNQINNQALDSPIWLMLAVCNPLIISSGPGLAAPPLLLTTSSPSLFFTSLSHETSTICICFWWPGEFEWWWTYLRHGGYGTLNCLSSSSLLLFLMSLALLIVELTLSEEITWKFCIWILSEMESSLLCASKPVSCGSVCFCIATEDDLCSFIFLPM